MNFASRMTHAVVASSVWVHDIALGHHRLVTLSFGQHRVRRAM